MLVQQSPAQPLDVYLDAVLIANPQLLHYPLVLPEGLLIHLPKLSEFSQQQHANVISLWD
jgi:phage tail protein X